MAGGAEEGGRGGRPPKAQGGTAAPLLALQVCPGLRGKCLPSSCRAGVSAASALEAEGGVFSGGGLGGWKVILPVGELGAGPPTLRPSGTLSRPQRRVSARSHSKEGPQSLQGEDPDCPQTRTLASAKAPLGLLSVSLTVSLVTQ